MADKIQLRRDTAANWTSNDPILSEGEVGYETDTGRLKVGDGSTAWTSLAYMAGGSVTSVAIAGTDGLEVDSGSPITSAGTINLGVDAAALRTHINVEDGATADQTGAEIKAAYEAEADTNAFTDADETKLDGIEAGADVTDAGNVEAAGAIMDSDFSANGTMTRTGAGTYITVLNNYTATTAPTAGDDTGDGYAVGSRWIDVTNDKEYVCLDATATAAVWTETTGGGGGASSLDDLSDVDTTTTPPTSGDILEYDGSNFVPVVNTGGGAAGNATSHFLIEEITNTTAGEFDFDNIPQDYDSIYIEGQIRSTSATNTKAIVAFINGDETTGNYHRQYNYGKDNSSWTQTSAYPYLTSAPGSTSPSDSYSTLRIDVVGYANADTRPFLKVSAGAELEPNDMITGDSGVIYDTAEAVTRIKVEDETSTLIGTLRLIGVKAVSIEDSQTIITRVNVPVTLSGGQYEVDLTDYQDGDRLVIHGAPVSSDTGATEGMNITFNDDTSYASNYRFQGNYGDNGGEYTGEGNTTFVGVPATSFTTGPGSSLRIEIEDYAGSSRKMALSTFSSEVAAQDMQVGNALTRWASTAAITNIKLTTDNHPTHTLSGPMYAYIEKQGVLPLVNKASQIDTSTAPTGTLASPPTGMAIDDLWLDTTDSANHPIVRAAKVGT